jgi:hypothetical protein
MDRRAIEDQNECMRWLAAYFVGALVAAGLFMLFIGYGIGGCDCTLGERGVFCWLCEHQWVIVAVAVSPLWVTALLNLHSNWRQHKRDLYGDERD